MNNKIRIAHTPPQLTQQARVVMRFALLAASVLTVASAVPASAAVTSTFRDVSTLRCLDSNTSGNVYTLPCNGGNFQNWQHA